MRKFMLFAMVVILCMAMTSMAFANITLGGTEAVSSLFGGGIYKPSTAVTVVAISEANRYCASGQHSGAASQTSGLQYSTTSGSPAITPAAATTTAAPTTCTLP
jgi:hypothetical protein